MAVPAEDADSVAVHSTNQSVASQSYPASLIEICQVQYVSEEAGGRTSALNAAKENATGRYLIQTEPGTTWDPTKIEKQVLRLEEKVSRHGTAHPIQIRTPLGRQRTDFGHLKSLGPAVGSLIAPPWGPGSLMLRADAASELGAYRYLDDMTWEYGVRVCWENGNVDLLEEELGEASVNGNHARPLEPSGRRHRFLSSYIDKVKELEPGQGGSSDDLSLLSAALHILNDDLERAHPICNAFERTVPDASFLHGIIHRREPDFKNARNWFGRAEGLRGGEAIRAAVLAHLQRVLQKPEYGGARDTAFGLIQHLQKQDRWDPLYFLDLCEKGAWRDNERERRLLEEIQETELVAAIDQVGSRAGLVAPCG